MKNNFSKEKRKKLESWKIFDKIYFRYDLLNKVLSFGLDYFWRKKLIKRLLQHLKFNKSFQEKKILDIATGTGDILMGVLKKTSKVSVGVGIDLSQKMLMVANKKSIRAKLNNKIRFVHGSATELPFVSDEFDYITISFGIRNIIPIEFCFSEIKRVLKPGGKIFILEFSLPTNKFISFFHSLYLSFWIPFIGYLFTKDAQSYRYLSETIKTFPYGQEFCSLAMQHGFSLFSSKSLCGGIVNLYEGN